MRDDLKIVWDVPPTPPGLVGRVERFMGPGTSPAEWAVGGAGLVVCGFLLVAGTAGSADWRGWSGLQCTVVVLVGLDLVGGVLTNATHAAKRWYHRPGPGRRRARLLFVTAHLGHLLAVGLIVLSGDWRWTLTHAGLLLAGAVVVEFTPLHLKRPVAMGVLMAAVLVDLFWLDAPAALGWFAPLFFLKLLVCHLVPEAPLERGRRPDA
ncbi:hypothetical protein ACQPZG_03025 (plasmid) [Streptomyces sp. CA-294286]|uniref:hypothetical protein n=1 Tax=Streptomyces sp. CA-294286 TaxID=3240070 RepID=UPI003D8B664B